MHGFSHGPGHWNPPWPCSAESRPPLSSCGNRWLHTAQDSGAFFLPFETRRLLFRGLFSVVPEKPEAAPVVPCTFCVAAESVQRTSLNSVPRSPRRLQSDQDGAGRQRLRVAGSSRLRAPGRRPRGAAPEQTAQVPPSVTFLPVLSVTDACLVLT